MSEIEYKHRNLKEAIFNLCCLAHIGVNDKTLINNLNADCEKELALYEDLKQRYSKLYQALEIIKENFIPYDIEILKNGKVRIWVGHDKYFDVSKEKYNLLLEVLS